MEADNNLKEFIVTCGELRIGSNKDGSPKKKYKKGDTVKFSAAQARNHRLSVTPKIVKKSKAQVEPKK